MVYAAMKDNVSARQWAAFRLPAYSKDGSNRRRTRWAEKAVLDATILLHQGEKRLATAFGESDKVWMEKQVRTIDESDADAWQ